MSLLDHLIAMAGTNPFLAVCELWLIGCLAGVAFKIINRTLRTFKVALRGWPPSHLDADGDFKGDFKSQE